MYIILWYMKCVCVYVCVLRIDTCRSLSPHIDVFIYFTAAGVVTHTGRQTDRSIQIFI